MRCVPKINGVYWLCLGLAGLFGANAGALLSDALGLGSPKGLPFLAAGLALVFLAERFLTQGSALFFWTAVVLLRTAATSISGLLREDHIRLASVPAMCLLLAFMVIVWRSREPTTEEQGVIPINAYYWLTLFVAGVLGTVAGDAASYPLGYGFLGALVAFAIPLAFLLVIGRNGLYADLGFHWLAVVLIVSAGTAAGNLLTHETVRAAEFSTGISGLVFLGAIVVAYEMRTCNRSLETRTAPGALP